MISAIPTRQANQLITRIKKKTLYTQNMILDLTLGKTCSRGRRRQKGGEYYEPGLLFEHCTAADVVADID